MFLSISKSSSASSDSPPSTSYQNTSTSLVSNNGISANVAGAPKCSVVEDTVDIALDKLDGRIQRQRNETM